MSSSSKAPVAALRVHESARIEWLRLISIVEGGEVYLLADQVEEARACADSAVVRTRQRGERGHEAWAVRLLGEVCARRDPPDHARPLP